MNSELIVEIVTQFGVEFQGPVDGVVVPGALGYLGIRPGHAPLLTSLATGVVTLHTSGGDEYSAVAGGVMEVFDNRVTLLADAAEMASKIDIERVQQAMRRAQQRLEAAYRGPEREAIDTDRARLALARALNRLHAAGKAGMLG